MLQKMLVKVAEEGKKEEFHYEKFMCSRKNNVCPLQQELSMTSLRQGEWVCA